VSPCRYILLVFALCLGCTACAERPRFGVEITNSPTIRECIPGSATKPC
jgi:hypothetical protein